MNSAGRMQAVRTLIEIGLTIALAAMVGTSIWTFLAQSDETAVGPAFAGAQTSFDPNTENPARYAILQEINPFSILSEDEQSAADSAVIDAPETSLNLVLKGSRAVGDQQGIAVIQLPDNRQIRAEVGDEILDGVVLDYIFADRITLNRSGKLENLFKRDSEGETSVILPAGSGEIKRDTPPANSGSSSGKHIISASDFWRNVQLTIVRDEKKVHRGYRVLPRVNAEVLSSAGFEPNDIIRAVNSKPITEIDSEELQELTNASGAVRFEVERDGRTVQVRTEFTRGSKP